MKWLAALLLVGVFVRHDAAFLLASWTGWTPAAVFYVLGGFWEAILCGTLFVILNVCERTIWRDLAAYAMVIGVAESVMVSGCRLALTAPPPKGMTSCEHVTGWPIGQAMLALEIMGLCWLVGSWMWKR